MNKKDESQSKDQQAPAAALQVINAVPVTTQAEAIVRPAVTTDQAIEAWNAYLELKRKIKTADDVQIIEKKEFLKKSYWRKIATFFNLNVEKIDEKMQPVGNTILFDFTCKAIAPNGRSAIGTGSCDIYEKAIFKNGQYLKEVKKWSESLKKMVRVKDGDGNYKYEPAEPNSLHNTRTTAETRAFNRAVSNLVGGGEVSAEEIQTGHDSGDQDQQAAPKQAPAPAPAAAAAKPQAPTTKNPQETKKIGKALNWDELADIYDKITHGHARTKPMDAIFDWAAGNDNFFVDPKAGTIHLYEQATAPKTQDTKAPAAKKDAPKANVDTKKEAKEIPEGFKAEYDACLDKLNAQGKRGQVCCSCEAHVDTAVYYYAFNNWGKILCRACQKKYADFKK